MSKAVGRNLVKRGTNCKTELLEHRHHLPSRLCRSFEMKPTKRVAVEEEDTDGSGGGGGGQTASLLDGKTDATQTDNKTGLVSIPATENKTFLHPDSAKQATKKRNYSIGVIAKIIRRGPKKKAGCAYEKRLSLEIKAAKTVAIVTGCFIFCWLGFSKLAELYEKLLPILHSNTSGILYGFSFSIEPNDVVWSIVFWLGYLNSALNVWCIYNGTYRLPHYIFTIFSPSSTQSSTGNSARASRNC